MLCYTILAVPLAAGALAGVMPWRRAVGWMTSIANAGVLGLGIALAIETDGHRPLGALDGALRADALSAFMVIVIGTIALLAAVQAIRYLEAEIASGRSSARHASLYCVLVQVFVTCMLAAVLSANLGGLWVAVEATTIATTFLVGHRRTDGALEASWKYVLICSVGIALAFLGTVFVYFAALHVPGHATGASVLDWTSLMAVSHHLNPAVMRLAMALLVLGYGTKVGLAPMHSWLPDAHSQAPAPVSALMSGVLLTVAFYALLRFKAVADGALGPDYVRMLLVIVGLASLFVAASLLLTQRDYKRMLAYHSIEHMGLIAIGAAAGTTLAIAAVLLHILGHGLAKAVLFLASGEILLVEGTSEIESVPALLSRRPVLGGIFGFGLVALLGLPPFSLFVSELNMIRAELDVGLGWAAGISLLLMAVIFAAVMAHGRHLLLGGAGGADKAAATPRIVAIPLISGLVACAVFGLSAWPLQSLLYAAAHVVAR
ncbi:MAG: proton-conducting transporter transmembrane domain-containing protein [Acidimicrobiales bacterium]